MFLYQSTTIAARKAAHAAWPQLWNQAGGGGHDCLRRGILESPHPYADLLNYRTASSDSFIKRIRLKTGVYGEFKLWPHTVLGIKWLINRRRYQTKIRTGKYAGESIAMTTEQRASHERQWHCRCIACISSGNTSQEIPNCWKRLVTRMTEHILSANATATDAIRDFCQLPSHVYSGEVASLFLQHGSPFQEGPTCWKNTRIALRSFRGSGSLGRASSPNVRCGARSVSQRTRRSWKQTSLSPRFGRLDGCTARVDQR